MGQSAVLAQGLIEHNAGGHGQMEAADLGVGHG